MHLDAEPCRNESFRCKHPAKDAVRRLGEYGRPSLQALRREVETGATEVRGLVAGAVDEMKAASELETHQLHARVAKLNDQVDSLKVAADFLKSSFDPIWDQLPRNLYLGIGVFAGAALVIVLGTVKCKWHGLRNDLSQLELRRVTLAANLEAFEQQTGFKLVCDGNRTVIALDDGFEIERYVSVRGPFGRGLPPCRNCRSLDFIGQLASGCRSGCACQMPIGLRSSSPVPSPLRRPASITAMADGSVRVEIAGASCDSIKQGVTPAGQKWKVRIYESEVP